MRRLQTYTSRRCLSREESQYEATFIKVYPHLRSSGCSHLAWRRNMVSFRAQPCRMDCLCPKRGQVPRRPAAAANCAVHSSGDYSASGVGGFKPACGGIPHGCSAAGRYGNLSSFRNGDLDPSGQKTGPKSSIFTFTPMHSLPAIQPL